MKPSPALTTATTALSTKARPSAASSPTPGSPRLLRTYQGHYTTPEDYASSLRSWTFACIDERAKALASLNYVAVRTTLKGGQRAKKELTADHWAVDRLDNPNDIMGWTRMVHLLSMMQDSNGNAYLWTPRYGGTVPLEFWPLPSARMRMVTGRTADDPPILGYIYQGTLGEIAFDAREVCHFRHLRPHYDAFKMYFVGQSLIRAAIDAVRVDQQVQAYLANYFENGALPAFAIRDPLPMGSEQWQEFKGRLDETYTGARNAGRWMLLDGAKDIAPIQSGGREAELSNIDLTNRDRICSIFGVPEPLLTGKHPNRATAATIEWAFYDRTVKYLANDFCDELSRHLRQFEVGLRIEYVMQGNSDPDMEQKRWQFLIDNGVPINRVFAEMGVEPVPGGDEPTVLSNRTPLSLLLEGPPAPVVVAPPPAPEPTPNEGAPDLAAPDDAAGDPEEETPPVDDPTNDPPPTE